MSDERDIQQVIAKYVRAVDRRDGAAIAELFIPNGKVTIFYTNGGKEELIVELAGREMIGDAMPNLMKPHPTHGWSRHTTFDTIIEVDGERATIDAQFIVYNVVGA
ncbi:MAG TPA: nuclear transport factor 2 family protein, partial [Candidatus Binatia bacterium]|nr:nuclear transport factor 2 family protein [Candidatus Binatia bacterium]